MCAMDGLECDVENVVSLFFYHRVRSEHFGSVGLVAAAKNRPICVVLVIIAPSLFAFEFRPRLVNEAKE